MSDGFYNNNSEHQNMYSGYQGFTPPKPKKEKSRVSLSAAVAVCLVFSLCAGIAGGFGGALLSKRMSGGGSSWAAKG